jgi:hypothetical protein
MLLKHIWHLLLKHLAVPLRFRASFLSSVLDTRAVGDIRDCRYVGAEFGADLDDNTSKGSAYLDL